MKQHAQWIIHRLKVPCDWRTGQPADAHSTTVWTNYQTAVDAAGRLGADYGVGFVFTEAAGYWFLDIDKCLISGYWSALAVELCNLFHGARIEVSQSGTGLHIFGRGTVPEHGCRNREHGLEFYTSGRYVAYTDLNAVGDSEHDCSALMPAFVAKYFPPEAEVVSLSEGHELGWELPSDDDLVTRALAMTGGASSIFGGRISFKDLWTADTSALSKAYPAEGRPYDASAADLALASKLAWLTGNDGPRIERLMWRSALVREKWEKHKNYLPGFTIPRGAVKDGVFYDPKYRERRDAQRAELTRESPDEIDVSEILTVDEMLERFVFVNEGKRIVDLKHPNRILALDEWRASLKASTTEVEVPGQWNLDGTPKRKQFETTQVWEKRQHKDSDTVTFHPGAGLKTVDPDHKRAINLWRPIDRTQPANYDPGIFLRQVSYLFGDDAERFLDWLAHIEQKPGVLPHTGWVHISPMQGTGRNWLSTVLFKVWPRLVAPSFDLAGTLKNGYNGALSCKLLAIVDEINEGGSSAKWDNAEALKSLVTPAYRQVNPKYGHQRVEYNACRWLIFSNHISALPLTETDRRFNVVHNELPPRPSTVYAEMYDALDTPGFIESVAWFLKTRNASEFRPGDHAHMSEAKKELVGASRSDSDELLSDVVRDHPSDVIETYKIVALLTGVPFGGRLTPAHRHSMQRQGIRPYAKAVKVDGKVIKVSILRNHATWKNAEAYLLTAELKKVTG